MKMDPSLSLFFFGDIGLNHTYINYLQIFSPFLHNGVLMLSLSLSSYLLAVIIIGCGLLFVTLFLFFGFTFLFFFFTLRA